MSDKTVLIVDDEEINRMLIEAILDQMDVTYLSAANGQEAVDICEKHHIDIVLVLMDMMMPVMNGIEATKIINKRFPDLPIVVVSAMMLDQLEEELKNLDVKFIMCKPISREKIEYLVKTYVK